MELKAAVETIWHFKPGFSGCFYIRIAGLCPEISPFRRRQRHEPVPGQGELFNLDKDFPPEDCRDQKVRCGAGRFKPVNAD
jgi:hypothetical protein